MTLWSEWWVWLSAALALATLEVLVPGFVFLGFALGALVIGLLLGAQALGLSFLGLAGLSLPWLLVVFAVLSGAAYVILRQMFRLERGQIKRWDTDIND